RPLRFHPNEELVDYYLKRKVSGRPLLRIDAIAEVDLCKCEPWELPGRFLLHSRDLEWYFLCLVDRKNLNRSRTNRATNRGYWKTTGYHSCICFATLAPTVDQPSSSPLLSHPCTAIFFLCCSVTALSRCCLPCRSKCPPLPSLTVGCYLLPAAPIISLRRALPLPSPRTPLLRPLFPLPPRS
ncbi:hypothetical protein BHM03_00020457, partial [Ensete ventricosum]